MSELFARNFSDALIGPNGFDGVFTANGTITQSAGAGLNGTVGGVTCARTGGGPNVYGWHDYSLVGASIIRMGWYTNISQITIGVDGQNFALFRGQSSTGAVVAVVVHRNPGGVLRFRLYLYKDDGSFSLVDAPFGLPAWLELRMVRASANGVSDGEAQLFAGGGDFPLAGALVVQVTGVPNWNKFEAHIRGILGINNIFANNGSLLGSLIVDEWRLRDDDLTNFPATTGEDVDRFFMLFE